MLLIFVSSFTENGWVSDGHQLLIGLHPFYSKFAGSAYEMMYSGCLSLIHISIHVPFIRHRQAMLTQARRCRMWRLIKVFIDCLLNVFSKF